MGKSNSHGTIIVLETAVRPLYGQSCVLQFPFYSPLNHQFLLPTGFL